MQAVTRHDISLSTENSGGEFFHVHQFEQAELAFFMVKKRSTSDSSVASPRAVDPNK
jgi:hypothetical protein